MRMSSAEGLAVPNGGALQEGLTSASRLIDKSEVRPASRPAAVFQLQSSERTEVKNDHDEADHPGAGSNARRLAPRAGRSVSYKPELRRHRALHRSSVLSR